jgi:predicted membrane channel-forming protein YqfA (hemolysin III family)
MFAGGDRSWLRNDGSEPSFRLYVLPICSSPARTLMLLRGVDFYLLMPVILASMLLPFLFVLFYYSTSCQRQTFMFAYVVVAVGVAIAGYIYQAVHEVRSASFAR